MRVRVRDEGESRGVLGMVVIAATKLWETNIILG